MVQRIECKFSRTEDENQKPSEEERIGVGEVEFASFNWPPSRASSLPRRRVSIPHRKVFLLARVKRFTALCLARRAIGASSSCACERVFCTDPCALLFRSLAVSLPPLVRGEIVGDRACAAAGNEFHILGEHTGAVARIGRFPLRSAGGQFMRCDVKIEAARGSVNRDFVTFANERDAPAYGCLRGNVAYHHPVTATGKAAVGYQRHRIAEAGSNQRRRRCEHFTHSRATLRPFVTDYDYIAARDSLRKDRLKAVLF